MPAEVPEVKEFHEAITNEDDPTGVINEGVSVEELNVTSDTVKGQPEDGDIHEIGNAGNAENAEMNLAATSYVYVILLLAAGVMILGALCMAACWKKVRERMARRKKRTVGDCELVEISVVDANEAENSAQSPPPHDMDKSEYRSTVYQKTEYVPQEKSYFF